MPDRAIVRAEGAQCHSADNAVGFRIDDAQPGSVATQTRP